MRESWVKVMELRIVREKLGECYRREGVNHMETCKHLAERYLDMLKDSKIQGYRIVEQGESPALGAP